MWTEEPEAYGLISFKASSQVPVLITPASTILTRLLIVLLMLSRSCSCLGSEADISEAKKTRMAMTLTSSRTGLRVSGIATRPTTVTVWHCHVNRHILNPVAPTTPNLNSYEPCECCSWRLAKTPQNRVPLAGLTQRLDNESKYS